MTCNCENVEIGSHDNTILLGYYPVMQEYRERRMAKGMPCYGIAVDRCIADQVIELWNAGVRTYGCCCGHNKLPGFINVDPRDFDKAVAAGFEPYLDDGRAELRNTVKTKEIK